MHPLTGTREASEHFKLELILPSTVGSAREIDADDYSIRQCDLCETKENPTRTGANLHYDSRRSLGCHP
jgi:hypothetical protein